MNPIKPTIKSEIFPIIVIIITILASFYFYANFPEKVPTHWNINGTPDAWSSREIGAFSIPAVAIGIYFLFLFIPKLDPKKERYADFRKVYHVFKSILVFVMSLIYFIASLNVLGYNVPIELWTPLIIGILFIILGNYFGKIKPNWFMGIRTPWTLSSEEVWNKTHRAGGKVFMIGGLLMIMMPLIPSQYQPALFIALIFILVCGTIGLSYYYYRIEQNNLNTHKND